MSIAAARWLIRIHWLVGEYVNMLRVNLHQHQLFATSGVTKDGSLCPPETSDRELHVSLIVVDFLSFLCVEFRQEQHRFLLGGPEVAEKSGKVFFR